MAEDRVVELLERENAWLRGLVEQLQDKIISLSDPLALARVQAAARPRVERQPRPTREDRMTREELAALEQQEVAPATEPKVSDARAAIEREFEVT